MVELRAKTLTQVVVTFAHTWPYLVFSVLVAAVLKVHVEPARLRAWLARHQRASVVGAIGLSVLTPLCSCGTMALVLAMLATSMPWATGNGGRSQDTSRARTLADAPCLTPWAHIGSNTQL